MRATLKICGVIVVVMLAAAGCGTLKGPQKPRTYRFPQEEPGWVRDGEPIEFENERWFPQDDVEILLDSEVDRVGEYRGVEIFIEKIDVRPYNRLYTKFGDHKFRLFEKKKNYD